MKKFVMLSLILFSGLVTAAPQCNLNLKKEIEKQFREDNLLIPFMNITGAVLINKQFGGKLTGMQSKVVKTGSGSSAEQKVQACIEEINLDFIAKDGKKNRSCYRTAYLQVKNGYRSILTYSCEDEGGKLPAWMSENQVSDFK
jgi:hypothetical protein